MGEKAVAPQKNGVHNENEDSEEEMETESEGNEYDDDDVTPEEFQLIDDQLNALNSALDDIEQKNENIQEQLQQLLQSNKEIRKQIQIENTPDVNVQKETN